jgi:cytochrome c556
MHPSTLGTIRIGSRPYAVSSAPLKGFACVLLITAIAGVSTEVSAQFAKPEDAVKYRKNALFVMQQHFARLAAMAQGKAPYDAKMAADNALVVANMSVLPWAGFVEGTDKGDTKAKAEIWKDKENFRQLSEKFVVEVGKLKTASATGKLDDLKAAVNATAGACKACHDEYRAK